MPIMPPTLPVRGPHLKLALLLAAAGLLATLALWPHLLVLMPEKLSALPVSLPVAIATQTVKAGVLCWLLSWLGLFLGARHGLGAPWLRAWIYRRERDPAWPSHWWMAAALGAAAASLVAALSLVGRHCQRIMQAPLGLGLAWRAGIILRRHRRGSGVPLAAGQPLCVAVGALQAQRHSAMDVHPRHRAGTFCSARAISSRRSPSGWPTRRCWSARSCC
ncbi:MAG: hypothetical protein ABI767_03845 [Rhodanobacter sp.]